MSLVIVAGTDLETAVHVFDGVGFEARSAAALPVDPPAGNLMVALSGDVAAELRQADSRGLRYQLVHVGPDDGIGGGSFARAHHRVQVSELPALAERLRPRERMTLVVMAFGFKNGVPGEADWVFDSRFLDNPYWVPDLRELDGRDPGVQSYVLGQPAATALLDSLERVLRVAIERGRESRSEITVAFGCTGGRHRSVALAVEMARRLDGIPRTAVELRLREL